MDPTKSRKHLELKPETRVTHQPQATLPRGNAPLSGPIYQSVKFGMPTMAEVTRILTGELDAYFYSRVANPTVHALEEALAEMQGRDSAICFSSGVAALSSVLLGVLAAGDHVVMFRESYKPTRYLLNRIFARYNVTTTMLSLHDLSALEKTLAARKTRLIVFEAWTNPMLRVADIGRITELAQKYGAETLLDNTFSGIHNHGQYPVDWFVHSLTKYVGGHGDVLGGAVIARKALIRKIHTDMFNIGATLDPHAAFLIARGLKTYFVRWRAHCANALALANWLAKHPKVKNLRHPGLASDPDHAVARAQLGGGEDFGGMIAFDVDCAPEKFPVFLDALKIFRVAGSLGATESLVAPVKLFYGGDLSDQDHVAAGLTATSVRLSIGIEAESDLRADLQQALGKLHY